MAEGAGADDEAGLEAEELEAALLEGLADDDEAAADELMEELAEADELEGAALDEPEGAAEELPPAAPPLRQLALPARMGGVMPELAVLPAESPTEKVTVWPSGWSTVHESELPSTWPKSLRTVLMSPGAVMRGK